MRNVFLNRVWSVVRCLGGWLDLRRVEERQQGGLPAKPKREAEPPLKWLQDHVGGRGLTRERYLSALGRFNCWLTEQGLTPKNWDEVTLTLVRDYSEWCRGRYSASRYNMLMMVLRNTLKRAHQQEEIPFRDEELIHFLEHCHASTHVADDGRVALTPEQVDALFRLPLGRPKARLVRDMFVLQCLTSLRFSNVSGADFRPFRGMKEFDVVQVKEKGSINQHIALAMDGRIAIILERNGWVFPNIGLSVYNNWVKRIVSQLPWAGEPVHIKTRLADGTTRVVTKPLFEAVRSHNGRRTFITELRSNPLVQDRDLAAFTGHKSLSLLAVYDKTTKQRRAQNVLRALSTPPSPTWP